MWYLFKVDTSNRVEETQLQEAAAVVETASVASAAVPEEKEEKIILEEEKKGEPPVAAVSVAAETMEVSEAASSVSEQESVKEEVVPVVVVEGESGVIESAVAASVSQTVSETMTEPAEPGRVPDPPLLFDPIIVMSGGDFYALAPDTPEYNDDFFADFFVQGTDKIALDDGSYYFELYIMDDRMGQLEVLFQGNDRLLNTAELKYYLSDMLTDEAYEKYFGSCQEFEPSEYFTERGATMQMDEEKFVIHMYFDVSEIPDRIISLSQTVSSRSRYTLTGAQTLSPAFFTWVTTYNFYSSYNWYDDSEFFKPVSWYLSLSASNYMSFGKTYLDFYYNVTYRDDELKFSWSSYRFFRDFVKQCIRISWGNVYGYGLSNQGTSLGIQFEKSYSYGGPNVKRPTNQRTEVIVVAEESVLKIESNGRVIYERTVAPGNYRIKDFSFDTGINEVLITVTPTRLDGLTEEQKEEGSYKMSFSLAYDSQLLAPGETLYGGSATMGRVQVDKDDSDQITGLGVRVSPEYYYDYHFDDIAISWWQDVGITETFTLGMEFSAATAPNLSDTKDYAAETSVSFLNANPLGTTELIFETRLNASGDTSTFGFQSRFNHRFIMHSRAVSSLSFTLTYANPDASSQGGNEFGASVSFGGSIGFLRYSMSSSIYKDDTVDDPSWRINGSIGCSPMKNLSLSTSISAYKSYNSDTQFVGYITASCSFGKGITGNYSTDYKMESANFGLSVPIGKDYLQMNVSNFYYEDPENHTFAASYSHRTDLFNIGLRGQAYDRYNRYNGSVSVSTSTFYAGGAFAMSRSSRDNFMLVKPQGSLRGSTIQVARSNGGNATYVPTVFGTGVYTSLTANTRNNTVVYLTGEDSFADTQTLSYELHTNTRTGFVIKARLPEVFTVSGIVKMDGILRADFSSPVQLVVENPETNEKVLDTLKNAYLFTDIDGRFIISDLPVGQYVIDYDYNGKWYALIFDVPVPENDKDRVIVLRDFDFRPENIHYIERDFEGNVVGTYEDCPVPSILEDYEGYVYIPMERITDNASFWNELFPPMEEDDYWSAFESYDVDWTNVESDSSVEYIPQVTSAD
ncbi:MAG: hypothetical protein IJ831_02860 [Spirochaetales bacterium]|nr:hypothetical protein [Spirochaetales bacterium]